MKRCRGKQKHCWLNCNFTGLFVLDNSCNGGIVVQSISVDCPSAFNTPPTNGYMYARKEDSWQNCPPLKGPVKWNIWPWSGSCTHTIYRPPPSLADTVPLWLSFSIWVVDFSESFPWQLGKSSGQQHVMYMQDASRHIKKLWIYRYRRRIRH